MLVANPNDAKIREDKLKFELQHLSRVLRLESKLQLVCLSDVRPRGRVDKLKFEHQRGVGVLRLEFHVSTLTRGT
ncbi:MAG TPA: hypothetical protein DET40_14005 [Lentisphaeria bacterium]|nr:hypothetical protein [Lentisphaeria bacterium]